MRVSGVAHAGNISFINSILDLSTSLSNLSKELELPKRPFHSIRHTHATELLSNGEPDYLVAKRLGDEVATVLNTYAHPKSEDDRRLAHTYAERIKSA